MRGALSFAALDVDYRAAAVVAAAVGFVGWDAAEAAYEDVVATDGPAAPYQPGQFYRRELPYLQDVLGRRGLPDVVVVDGFVWLGPDAPGLGARLHEALGARAAVVGVAKRPYRGASGGAEVRRGGSATPLFVTSVGMPLAEAAAGVARMHGAHRVPTLLKRVDRLARDARG